MQRKALSSRPFGTASIRDGIVTVNIIRAEMGQHIGTALARILADELEADWRKVRIVEVDSDPRWGYMVTGGSWSVWMTFPVFSRAGAAGRIALIEAGAKLLGIPADRCTARGGAVIGGSRSVSYGEIVARGDLRRSFSAEALAKMPIKPASERRLIGRDTDAIDIPAEDQRHRALRHRCRRRTAWSMRGRRSRRRATGRACGRSTMPPPNESRATSAVSRSRTRPIRFRAGSWCSRAPIPPPFVPPTSSRSIGWPALVQPCPSKTFSTMARSRSPIRRAARCWWTIRA